MTRPHGRREPSLLQSLQSLLERTYRMDTGVADIGMYVIGDHGYRLFYASAASSASSGSRIHRAGSPGSFLRTDNGSRVRRVLFPGLGSPIDAEGGVRPASQAPMEVGSASGSARVMVHDGPGPIAARIYYPDALIRNLEACPPLSGIGDRNIDDFATFVEELDHFLLIAERARLRKPVSLLELELHANVTKFLVCALFLATRSGRGTKAPLGSQARLWLLWHLFEKAEFAEPDREVLVRYREASRFARRFIDSLERETSVRTRLGRLRAFHDATHQQKLASLS